MLRADENRFQIEIPLRAAEVFHFHALDLNLFHQTLVVRIQRIQHINQIVLFLVRRGVIQTEQRIETLQCFLRHFSTHFLRFIHDDNRIVCRNHVNRTPGTEIVAFRINDTGGLVAFASFNVLFFVQ